MSDLIERLRKPIGADLHKCWKDRKEAADEIERLEGDILSLNENLKSARNDGYDMAKDDFNARIERLEAKIVDLERQIGRTKPVRETELILPPDSKEQT